MTEIEDLGILGILKHKKHKMGLSLELWRVRIGCFSQPIKVKTSFETLKLRQIPLCIRLCLFLILVSQCIEPNTGPTGPTEPGESSAGARGRGSSRRRGGQNARSKSASVEQQPPPSIQSGSKELRSKNFEMQSSQASLDTWVQATDNTTGVGLTDPDYESDFYDENDTDLVRNNESNNTTLLLLEIRSDVKQMNKKFDTLEKSVRELQTDNRNLKEQNKKLTQEVETLTTRLASVETTLSNTIKVKSVSRDKIKCVIEVF